MAYLQPTCSYGHIFATGMDKHTGRIFEPCTFPSFSTNYPAPPPSRRVVATSTETHSISGPRGDGPIGFTAAQLAPTSLAILPQSE